MRAHRFYITEIVSVEESGNSMFNCTPVDPSAKTPAMITGRCASKTGGNPRIRRISGMSDLSLAESSRRGSAPIAGLVLGYHRTVPGPDSSAVAGDPAPEPIHLIQSFANTLNADSEADLLGTREQAADWLHGAALLPGGAGLTGSEHGALLRLRDALRDVLAAHTAGREDAVTAARLTKALADGRLVLTVDLASTVRLASAARASYSGLVAAVAVAIAATAASGTWLRLKSCSDPRCGQAFLDGSATASARHCPAHAEPAE